MSNTSVDSIMASILQIFSVLETFNSCLCCTIGCSVSLAYDDLVYEDLMCGEYKIQTNK